jgi:hypothetical protein
VARLVARAIDGRQGPRFGRNFLQLNSIAAGRTLASSFFSASAAVPSARRPGHLNFPVDGRGVIFSGRTRDVVATGLTRPHSARLHEGTLWVDNSGYGEFGRITDARFEPVIRLKGWTRGLCITDKIAFVGTSRVIPRFRHYAPGLDVDRSRCGIHAVDLQTGRCSEPGLAHGQPGVRDRSHRGSRDHRIPVLRVAVTAAGRTPLLQREGGRGAGAGGAESSARSSDASSGTILRRRKRTARASASDLSRPITCAAAPGTTPLGTIHTVKDVDAVERVARSPRRRDRSSPSLGVWPALSTTIRFAAVGTTNGERASGASPPSDAGQRCGKGPSSGRKPFRGCHPKNGPIRREGIHRRRRWWERAAKSVAAARPQHFQHLILNESVGRPVYYVRLRASLASTASASSNGFGNDRRPVFSA